MSKIFLDEIDTLSATGVLAQDIAAKVKTKIGKYGSTIYFSVTTKTTDSIGHVTDISEVVDNIKLMVFDLFTTDRVRGGGISNKLDTDSSKKDTARAYMDCDGTIEPGDNLLINYNTMDETYTSKYKVVEIEAHPVADVNIFYTLYLQKVEN